MGSHDDGLDAGAFRHLWRLPEHSKEKRQQEESVLSCRVDSTGRSLELTAVLLNRSTSDVADDSAAAGNDGAGGGMPTQEHEETGLREKDISKKVAQQDDRLTMQVWSQSIG